jgi:hypothetical protein
MIDVEEVKYEVDGGRQRAMLKEGGDPFEAPEACLPPPCARMTKGRHTFEEPDASPGHAEKEDGGLGVTGGSGG